MHITIKQPEQIHKMQDMLGNFFTDRDKIKEHYTLFEEDNENDK